MEPQGKVPDLSLGDGRVPLELVHALSKSFQSGDYPLLEGAASCAATITCIQTMGECVYNMLQCPRQDSMSSVMANAVLSGYCNRFVGYP